MYNQDDVTYYTIQVSDNTHTHGLSTLAIHKYRNNV
jgi:hypothetical protein